MPIDARQLHGLKVFVVEDESLVAMQLEDMLLDLGCDLVGLAMRVGRALEMVAAAPRIDVAVLDVNIGGDKIYPVAEALRERGVPIVFATGYGRAGVEPDWQSYEILQKPYTANEVAEKLGLSVERRD
ncbi:MULTISPECIES: response regulator [unclassified Aureimonas]|uniref:response regulator n=1 Tax=unclassified Aureimonas TaxID=2615206 RepID=UPI0006FB046F|nr:MULTISPECIES: response regulator [unclassified Aureimonas]KQT52804.1 response regulator [Aureimonas sp. Leaf427]KQT80263.1 response regulator [Aureimonas sp. Leaf460]